MHTPDVSVQRSEMQKLSFLVGEWAGDATVLRGPGQFLELAQSERAEFRLGGLVLSIEGVGRSKADGSAVLQALGLISYDDAAETYRMRAFNDGRWLESDVTLMDGGRSIGWGFALGEFSTKSVLWINEQGEWCERAELTIGDRPPVKLMELTVRKV